MNELIRIVVSLVFSLLLIAFLGFNLQVLTGSLLAGIGIYFLIPVLDT